MTTLKLIGNSCSKPDVKLDEPLRYNAKGASEKLCSQNRLHTSFLKLLIRNVCLLLHVSKV